MPQFERGPEREWHEEKRTEKWSLERDAWEKIKEVIDKYHGDPWQIPEEQQFEFREAAELIISTAETDPDFKPKQNILSVARDIIKIIPAPEMANKDAA